MPLRYTRVRDQASTDGRGDPVTYDVIAAQIANKAVDSAGRESNVSQNVDAFYITFRDDSQLYFVVDKQGSRVTYIPPPKGPR